MPTGPVFYNNVNEAGNRANNQSNFITLGNGLIKAYQDVGEERLIGISLVDETIVARLGNFGRNNAVINGFPLSASYCQDPVTNPSGGDNVGAFYALDVILATAREDAPNRNPSQIGNTILANPVINGTTVGISQVADYYYLKVHKFLPTAVPTGLLNFAGLTMAYGTTSELIVRDSGYILSDIDRYAECSFFGTPIRVGMINAENTYYLIMNDPPS